MGIELMDIGVKMKQSLIFTIRGCFRSVCNHPFLVGNLCFLKFLHSYFPFIFSFLVSASPVLICTAILLGALLSFGQSIVPEIDVEEKTTHESKSLKTGLLGDSITVGQNETRYIEHLVNEPILSETRNGEICREDVQSNAPEEKSYESKNDEICEDMLDEPKKNEVEPANDDKSVADSFDFETVNVDSLNSLCSSWKHVGNEDDDEDQEEEEEEEGVVSDSGSDCGESSSPDASIADIMPMLDELHPLLDEDSSTPMIQISRNDSGVVSERSSRPSTSSSSESVDDIENRDELEIEDDDEDDDEDDGQGDKDEGLKSVITWTDEDQKNLMDLGSSEIERNQRLENLILRRRRKNVSMVPEINLIDLENYDFPPHVAPISTGRQNPFDLPHDSYENIPGSAPSVLLQRRNPFEIPYEDLRQERPDLLINGDGSREDFTTFFKRHESFSVGPSVFAPNNAKTMRPYFVPERAVAEESSFTAFGRQSSEVSDSKASSIPETDSAGFIEDLEDQKKLLEEEEEEEEEEAIEEGPPEPQLISEMNHVAEIGHGSQSSSDEEDGESSESDLAEKSDIEPNYSCSEAVESGDVNIMVKEPVYDTSPPQFRKNLSSSSSGSCDVHHVESSTSLPPVVVKRTVSFVERDSENREIEKGVTSANEREVEILVDDKNAGRSEEEKRLVIEKGKTVVSQGSEGEYKEANERLMATPSSGGSTSMFHDIVMHELIEHHEEVPVPNTPVESHEKMRPVQNLNIPEIYELDRETSSSRGSPFSPDVISMPSSAGSHVDMQTINEETDEIKEMDEGVSSSSDLDSIGDFSVTQRGSSGEFEKQIIDSVEGEGETSRNMGDGDVDEAKHTRDEIDVYEVDTKCIPGLQQTSQTNTGGQFGTSSTSESAEVAHDCTGSKMADKETDKPEISELSRADELVVTEENSSKRSEDGTVVGPFHEKSIFDDGSIKEAIATQNQDHGVKKPEGSGSTTTAKEKDNASESSSSSSSSSSSESDRE